MKTREDLHSKNKKALCMSAIYAVMTSFLLWKMPFPVWLRLLTAAANLLFISEFAKGIRRIKRIDAGELDYLLQEDDYEDDEDDYDDDDFWDDLFGKRNRGLG